MNETTYSSNSYEVVCLFKNNNLSIYPSSFALLKTVISFKIQGILETVDLFNHGWLNLDSRFRSFFISHMKIGFLKPKYIITGLFSQT